jgi:hypothetical protein
MRLPRLTTRRLMVLVAVAAALFWGSIGLHRRQERFDHLASQHELELDLATPTALGAVFRRIQEGDFTEADSASMLAALRRKRAYHAAMRDKYRRAARYPWLPVVPDPPPK